jgi:phosphoadenosine phosphosulfate reductase
LGGYQHQKEGTMAELAFGVDAVNERLETASPYDALQWAVETFGDKLAIVTSFQPTGIVTLHMLQEIAPNITVLTIDTDVLFPETYTLADELETRFKLNLVRVRPALTLQEQAQQHGPALWETNPDQCCAIRKVAPLGPAIQPFEAWITGLRRDQSAGRSNVPIVEMDKRYQKIKISPLATWTEDMVWTYIHAYELPYNTLHDRNYPSIGCQPCTRAVASGEDIRAGRWTGKAKVECGLHTH